MKSSNILAIATVLEVLNLPSYIHSYIKGIESGRLLLMLILKLLFYFFVFDMYSKVSMNHFRL